jgi:hypothetical protein
MPHQVGVAVGAHAVAGRARANGHELASVDCQRQAVHHVDPPVGGGWGWEAVGGRLSGRSGGRSGGWPGVCGVLRLSRHCLGCRDRSRDSSCRGCCRYACGMPAWVCIDVCMHASVCVVLMCSYRYSYCIYLHFSPIRLSWHCARSCRFSRVNSTKLSNCQSNQSVKNKGSLVLLEQEDADGDVAHDVREQDDPQHGQRAPPAFVASFGHFLVSFGNCRPLLAP